VQGWQHAANAQRYLTADPEGLAARAEQMARLGRRAADLRTDYRLDLGYLRPGHRAAKGWDNRVQRARRLSCDDVPGYRYEVATCGTRWPVSEALTTGLSGKFQIHSNPASKPEPALVVGARKSRATVFGARWPVSEALTTGLSGKFKT
jgi:hypothetical protein